MGPCTTCGDSGLQRNKDRTSVRQQAQKQALEKGKPFCICEEAGQFFPAEFGTAVENKFNIVEVVSGLPGAA